MEDKNDLTDTLESIFDTAIDGIMTITDRGIVERMNPAAAELFGYNTDEVIGKNIKLLMPKPYQEEHDGYLNRYNRTKEARIIGIGREVQGLKKNGEVFPFRLAVSEVILHDRVIFAGIIHDLTQVHRANEEIKLINKSLEDIVSKRTYELESVVNTLLKTNRKLENEVKERTKIERKLNENEIELIEALNKEKQLNEMKSRFVSMASHEFRTPLTAILSSAALISRYQETTEQEKREKHVIKIKSAVSHLTGVLNDFLSLSRLEEGKLTLNVTNIDLVKLCEEVTETTKSLLKGERRLIHEVQGEARTITTDKGILKNILFNLISNASKYSNKDIRCLIIFKSDYLQIEVIDEGIGIPIEDQQFLFTRFFRAGNVTNIQGTGLGLNIVKRYVDLLHGTITFQSEPEIGTTFIVNLPYENI